AEQKDFIFASCSPDLSQQLSICGVQASGNERANDRQIPLAQEPDRAQQIRNVLLRMPASNRADQEGLVSDPETLSEPRARCVIGKEEIRIVSVMDYRVRYRAVAQARMQHGRSGRA